MNEYEKSLLNIDLLSLDEEWIKQPQIFMEAAEKASKLLYEKDIQKEKVEQLIAEKDLDIRKNPEKYKLEKITESAIKSALTIDKDIIREQSVLNDKIYEYNQALNFVKALEMKKKALEKEVELFQAQYFSVPKQKVITENYNVEKEIEKKGEMRQRRILNRCKV